MTKPVTPTSGRLCSPLWLVAGLIWLTFYRLSGNFGFYEDDLHFFGNVTNFKSISELTGWWKFCWTSWPQGRPLGYSAMYGLGYFANQLGGLAAFQFFGFLIQVANATLFHRFIHRYVSSGAALPATLWFGLASIDTVTPAFTFAFYYDVAVFFSLVAANLYPTSARPWAYVMLCATMLTQEPMAIPFLFVPWLVLPWDKHGLKRWLIHVAIWCGVILSVLALRAKIGDPWGTERVSAIAQSPLQTAARSLQSATSGFSTHLKLSGLRCVQAFSDFSFVSALVFVIAIGAIVLALKWETHRNLEARSDNTAANSTRGLQRITNRPEIRMLAVGLVCMSMPYAAYFRDYWYPCTAEHGFFSAVHVVATFGSALVVGALFKLLDSLQGHRWFSIGIAAIFFGTLVLFGQRLQTDYARNWRQQKEFWQAVYRLCPDVSDGNDVLVLNEGIKTPEFMNQFTWVDELTLTRMFNFPTSWHRPPRVYLVNANVAGEHIRFADGKFTWIFHPSILFHDKASSEVIDPKTVIVLRPGPLGYERLTADLPVKDGSLPLKPYGEAVLPSMPRKPFSNFFELPLTHP